MQSSSHCPRCDANVLAANRFCWKCGLNFGVAGAASGQALDRPVGEFRSTVGPSGSRFAFGLDSLLLTAAIVAIGAGLIIGVPGFGIPIAVLLCPPLVRTWLVVAQRKSTGRDADLFEKIVLYIGSVGTTLVITSTVLVAAAATFFFTCLALVNVPAQDPTAPLVVMGFAIFCVVGLLLWGFFYWIRARWRRDTAPPQR